MVRNQILSRHAQVHWVPILELLTQFAETIKESLVNSYTCKIHKRHQSKMEAERHFRYMSVNSCSLFPRLKTECNDYFLYYISKVLRALGLVDLLAVRIPKYGPLNFVVCFRARFNFQEIGRVSNYCRKTKTKAITPTNHNRSKQRDEPITIPSNYL